MSALFALYTMLSTSLLITGPANHRFRIKKHFGWLNPSFKQAYSSFKWTEVKLK